MSLSEKLRKTIRNVPDFPQPGIQFKDITPVLEDPALCRQIIDALAAEYKSHHIDAIAGVESRGFLFGMSLAMKMDVPFITIRKKGKLPAETASFAYQLEYGTAEIEVHRGSIKPNWKVLVHDDLLATGGTAAATASLVQQEGAQVAGFAFIVELGFLNGKEALVDFSDQITTLITF